ncbi:MAG: hypothetical protein RL282_1559 [Bacteroidota bacterium]|jgi:hypothetical protein|nr:PqqD family protein [Chitinophagia bacterium]
MPEYYSQNKEIMQSKIGEDVVMLDIDTGFYFGLDAVGSTIWSHLSHPISFEELISCLMSKYDIDQETCETETRLFLKQLLEKNIISKNS